MALSEPKVYQTKSPVIIQDIESSGNLTHYKGGMVVANAEGYAAIPSDLADQFPLGVYTGRQGQEFAVPSGEHGKIEIETGLIWIEYSGANQAHVGKLFYLIDDGDISETPGTNRNWAVPCRGWKPGYLLLNFNNPIKTA